MLGGDAGAAGCGRGTHRSEAFHFAVPAELDEHDKRFDNIDKGREAFQVQLTHTFGLAGLANLQAQHVDARVADVAGHPKKFAADL